MGAQAAAAAAAEARLRGGRETEESGRGGGGEGGGGRWGAARGRGCSDPEDQGLVDMGIIPFVTTLQGPGLAPARDHAQGPRSSCVGDSIGPFRIKQYSAIHLIKAKPQEYSQSLAVSGFYRGLFTIVLVSIITKNSQPRTCLALREENTWTSFSWFNLQQTS